VILLHAFAGGSASHVLMVPLTTAVYISTEDDDMAF